MDADRNDLVRTLLALATEKAGLGLNLVQDLSASVPPGFPNPLGIVPERDKLARLEAASAWIETGQVFLPREAPLARCLLDRAARRDAQTPRLAIVPPELFVYEDD